MIAARGFASPLIVAGLWLATALAGCGGDDNAKPDGGDGHIDVDGGDASPTEGGGQSNAVVVDTPSGTTATGMQDGHCDLLEAVLSVALGNSVGDCANADHYTRIVLQPGNVYPVPRALKLAGGTRIDVPDGATGRATITAAAGFVTDPSDPLSACLLSVSDGRPDVTVSDVQLMQDPAVTVSGACITKGFLTLRRTQIVGFGAGGVVATCLPASGCDHDGGGSGNSTTLAVLGSLIDGNHSARKGGGIALEGIGASLRVAHTAVVNNVSDADGGGIYLGGGWANDIIQDSTISNNSASGSGGGVLVRFPEMTNTYVNILTSTIAYNTAGNGGGIEFDPPEVGGHDVAVFGSIVAGNYAPTFDWNINAGWTPRGVFNCVNGSFIYVLPGQPRPTDMGGCVFDVRNPMLGPLMPLGGSGDLPLNPLLAGSPAVDGTVDDHTRDDQRDDWLDGVDQTMPSAWALFDPLVDGDGDGTAIRDLGAYERNDRWQTELLAVRAQGPASHAVVTIPAGYDRGAGTIYAATSATNEFLTYALPVAEAGRYDMVIGGRTGPDAGKFQVAVADDPAGPWTAIGTEQDGYAQPAAFTSFGPFPATFTAPGEKLVRFTVTGKNAASTGFNLVLDYIEPRKSTAACPLTALSAGRHHTCGLMTGGGLRCWGADDSGQLGDGGNADRARPPPVDTLSGVDSVATGATHTCVLSSDGNVRCWGANNFGQLGDGSTTARATPPTAPALGGVKAIATGPGHTCALMNTGGVRCWGANDSGQLGDGTTTARATPPGTDVLSGVKAIAAGGVHTCALTTAGGVRCWGGNGAGQLGDGTLTSRSTPPDADVIGGIDAISTGDTHTCALTTAGGVRCWGHNLYGELGQGNYDTFLAPPSTDALTGVKQVVAGNLFTCALTTTGGVRCWGFNSHGETGDDTPLQADRFSPQPADILTGVASLAVGAASQYVCARMSSGGLRCWGGNANGELGDGLSPAYALTPPTHDVPGFTGTCQ